MRLKKASENIYCNSGDLKQYQGFMNYINHDEVKI